MNCSNCGSPTLANQQFCRVCGAALMADEPSRFNPSILGLAFLVFIFGSLMVTITGKMLDMRWLQFAGVIIMFGGMFLIAAFALLRQLWTRKNKSADSLQSEPLLPADTTNKLPPMRANDFIPSVTENTTNLLKTPTSKERTTSD